MLKVKNNVEFADFNANICNFEVQCHLSRCMSPQRVSIHGSSIEMFLLMLTTRLPIHVALTF